MILLEPRSQAESLPRFRARKSATHRNSVIRSSMVRPIAHEQVRHRSNNALRIRIVLSYACQPIKLRLHGYDGATPTRARLPRPRLVNVHLSGRVMVPERALRQNRHDVLLVVDMRHRDRLRIDEVCECLVSGPLQPVSYEPSGNARKLQVQKHRVEKGQRRAYKCEYRDREDQTVST